jgi:hypothetical protein
LGLVLRRLSADWQERWGHPVLVVESFVDESLYRGTCYRACGFQAVGATEGFKRASRDFYEEHGQPKQLYLRELRAGACRRLRQARLPKELASGEAEVTGPCPFRAPALESLLECLGTLHDWRYGHGLRHKQRFVLASAVVCTLMGACGYRAFENTCKKLTQRQLRALGCTPDEEDGRYYPPSDSTFQRVLNQVDAVAVARMIGAWLAQQEIGALRQLAVDGKVLRGSGRHDGKPLQLLSAVTHHLRLTLDQVAIKEKSNGALGEAVCIRGWKSPKFGGKTAGIRNESEEWKDLTSHPRPRVACRLENRKTNQGQTYGSFGTNGRREAYPGKGVSRKRDPHPA